MNSKFKQTEYLKNNNSIILSLISNLNSSNEKKSQKKLQTPTLSIKIKILKNIYRNY